MCSHLSVISLENNSKRPMSYEVLLAVNKFTYVLCHYKEEMSSLEEERMKGDRLRPGIFFLANGWHENEAKWSPKMWVVRGLCCPLVELASDITSICPPWLHLLVLSFKESSFVDEIRLFCLCFISPRKGPGDVSWRVATKLDDARTLSPSGPGCSIKLSIQFNSIQFFIHTIQDIYISVHSRKIK